MVEGLEEEAGGRRFWVRNVEPRAEEDWVVRRVRRVVKNWVFGSGS